ncbi:MAG TPA: hypothetical protein VFM58_19240, partial [Solirubrobacteraceae bacterium]|nr:hypothetical protein [Solirubrobacteraceae bacterium]
MSPRRLLLALALAHRRSLIALAQLTDPQIADELSPARGCGSHPDRRIVAEREYRRLMRGHGLTRTPGKQLTASSGTASYSAFSPKPGLRFVVLDTVAEGGDDTGNLDDPQYRWLKAELHRPRTRHRLVVVFGHHTLANAVRFFRGRRGHGFWQINTASHIDWPQQSRLIEIIHNRDATLSLFGTIVDSAAPAAAPAPGSASAFTPRQLASLARTLAYNAPSTRAARARRMRP